MKFYRLEKKKYFKIWSLAMLKAVAISILLTVALMVILGYKFMIVSSGSMEPTLPVGSLVIVTPCDYEDLQLGDIVTTEGSGMYFTHRIVGKKYFDGNSYVIVEEGDENYDKGIWYTKGDANETADGPITREIVGKVYEENCLKWVGEVVMYVKANYLVLIIFAVILVVFVEVLNYLKSKLELDDIECYENDEE